LGFLLSREEKKKEKLFIDVTRLLLLFVVSFHWNSFLSFSFFFLGEGSQI